MKSRNLARLALLSAINEYILEVDSLQITDRLESLKVCRWKYSHCLLGYIK